MEATKVEVWSDFLASLSGEYHTVPRALSSPFIEAWSQRREEAKREAERLREEMLGAAAHGTLGELFPFTGQTAGMIREIVPAAEIVRCIVAEMEEALKRSSSLLT